MGTPAGRLDDWLATLGAPIRPGHEGNLTARAVAGGIGAESMLCYEQRCDRCGTVSIKRDRGAGAAEGGACRRPTSRSRTCSGEAGFGGTAAEVAALTPLTRAQLIDRVMDTSANPAVVEPAELASGLEEWQKMDALRRWWFDRMITTPTPLVERMTLFWSQPLRLQLRQGLRRPSDVGPGAALPEPGARELPDALPPDGAHRGHARVPRQRHQRGRRPNQNFARELMELMTLGPGNYTEADVDAVGPGLDRPRDRRLGPAPPLRLPPDLARQRHQDVVVPGRAEDVAAGLGPSSIPWPVHARAEASTASC